MNRVSNSPSRGDSCHTTTVFSNFTLYRFTFLFDSPCPNLRPLLALLTGGDLINRSQIKVSILRFQEPKEDNSCHYYRTNGLE